MLVTNNKKDLPAFLLISIIVFAIVAIRSYLIPFTHDEVATFYYYIQTADFLPFAAHTDANNHILNSILTYGSYLFFGDSPFALRIPNLLGLIALIYGTFRISRGIENRALQYLLFSFLLLSFHWLSFFSACRGYGLSMGLFTLGLSYFISYLQNPEKAKYYVWLSVCLQLALSANLTLIFITLFILFYVMYFQISRKSFLRASNISVIIINVLFIVFWINYLFFLKENNAFYLGKGDNYWKITFDSLSGIITGSTNSMVKYIFAAIFSIPLVLSVIKTKIYTLRNIREKLSQPLFALLTFVIILIPGFYLLKALLGVNYPEGRAALFFYVLFVLLLVFYLDTIKHKFITYTGIVFIAISVFHFAYNINFRKHSIEEYITIPEKFYTILTTEQENSKTKITIGGHPYTELIYSFINYRNGGNLNLADPAYSMTMNCDYYIASMSDSLQYKPYYKEITREPDWGYALLKRNDKIKRELVHEINTPVVINGSDEFVNIFDFTDTLLSDTDPILVELNFDVIQTSVPNTSWLVFEVNDSANENNIYKRIPLNWTRNNWNQTKGNTYSFVTGKLPEKCKRIVCYFWNIEKAENQIIINKTAISRLRGNGVKLSL